MFSVSIGGCDVDIVPIVKGLISEKDKIVSALSSKDYECTAVALGIEDIEALRRRDEIEGEPEPSDLDSVYSYILKDIGPINLPDPSFTYLVDECTRRDIPIIPLDMTDEEYSKVYCETVSTLEFLKEKRIIKKAMRTEFDTSTPERFAEQWDALLNEIKGYRCMSVYRENYMAEQLKDISRYRKNVLAVIEHERCAGILERL